MYGNTIERSVRGYYRDQALRYFNWVQFGVSCSRRGILEKTQLPCHGPKPLLNDSQVKYLTLSAVALNVVWEVLE